MRTKFHAMLDKALDAPPMRAWRMRRFDADFARGGYVGTCRGVYRSYADAAAAAPDTLPLGYDNAATGSMYRDRMKRVFPGDYPMMFWLDRAFQDGARRVFDLGGHVGVSYYAYDRYLRYPPQIDWHVHDVPAVMAAGRALAVDADARQSLRFEDGFEAVAAADVLFTSGCLQYLEQPLAARLATLTSRPRWLLVNLLPLHETQDYWTVQSIGRAFCPYHIQRRESFFEPLRALGYEIQDTWENAEKRCPIAFEPGHSLDHYHGAALRLD